VLSDTFPEPLSESFIEPVGNKTDKLISHCSLAIYFMVDTDQGWHIHSQRVVLANNMVCFLARMTTESNA